LYVRSLIINLHIWYKMKGKGHPRTGHEGPEGGIEI